MIKQTLLMAGAAFLFLGGILAGNLAATGWPGPGNWFGSTKPLQDIVLDKLTNELSLTPAQTARIAPIITLSCADLSQLSEESRARRLATLDEIGATIAPSLTARQQRRLEALEAHWQNRPAAKRDQRIVALF